MAHTQKMHLRVILFILTHCSRILGDVITTAAPNTGFVDILKQDLRRNNDDYLESTTISAKVHNPYLLETNTKKIQQNDTMETPLLKEEGTFSYRRVPQSNKLLFDTKNASVVQRRVFDFFQEKSAVYKPQALNKTEIVFYHVSSTPKEPTFSYNNTARVTSKISLFGNLSYTIPVPVPRDLKKHFYKSRNTKPRPRISKTTRIFKTTQDVKVSRPVKNDEIRSHSKENKMKGFIKRNKKLFEEFVQMKRKETNKKKKSPLGKYVNLRGKSSDDEGQLSDSSSGNQKHMRAVSSYEVSSLRPEQLDMAPAKGGKIHNLRVKGRLCQRHILIPEGPKYDSRGRAYVGAYGHEGGRDFSRTVRPKFLLPRCCNCCKKSVLGCE